MIIRNIAIIAHVDHGKTTLTDKMMEHCNMLPDGWTMDSNSIEQERGITIYAKNTSVYFNDPKTGEKTKINIVDTPGHADFGSEVERVIRSVDSVLLVVDAQEGPMPQTRFVLKKSLEVGLKPIVVINKIDKPAARPKEVIDEVLELFLELGADDSQIDFPVVYAIGRQGVAKRNLSDESQTLDPLFEMILEHVPPALSDTTKPLRMQPSNLGYDDFLGRLAIGRVYEGTIKKGQQVIVKRAGETRTGKITAVFAFEGPRRVEVSEAQAGDIIMVAGLPDIYIGDTICGDQSCAELPEIAVDEPTIVVEFLVNNSPFAGREGKFVTTRQIRERLERELEVNVGLKVDWSETGADRFRVYGRGEMHIAVLLETMRREGYELQVSRPEAVVKTIDGVLSEPFEEVIISTPESYQGAIIEKLGRRGVHMTSMQYEDGGLIRLMFEGPTRGLFGYRGQFVIDTKGEGIYTTRVLGFRKHVGAIDIAQSGPLVTMASGKALGFSLFALQERGVLFIGPGTEVYEGMVIGATSKGDEMLVNPTKGKQLTNVRSSGADENIMLIPPLEVTIERGLELMGDEEYLEITPKSVRIRKKYLTEGDRSRAKRQEGK